MRHETSLVSRCKHNEDSTHNLPLVCQNSYGLDTIQKRQCLGVVGGFSAHHKVAITPWDFLSTYLVRVQPYPRSPVVSLAHDVMMHIAWHVEGRQNAAVNVCTVRYLMLEVDEEGLDLSGWIIAFV